jgi:hypothetical protein
MVRRGLAALCLAVVATACTSGSSGVGAGVSSSPATHRLDEHANGSTVRVHPGDTVVVTLHSTYWTFAVPSDVLQPLGAPRPSPSHCPVVGGGCGTVTSAYTAGHVGRTSLRAHRDSCGEARRCSAAESDWSVTVLVG